MSTIVEPHVRRWTRDEYYKMAEAGLFGGNRVELIEGQIVEMSPMKSLHATAIMLVARALEDLFKNGYVVRWQMPLALDAYSEPDPDVAVVQGSVRDYTHQHPTTAALVVEVADTSLLYDRTEKARLYANAGIAEYWLVNVREKHVEVYRQPQPTAAQLEAQYTDVTVLKSTDVITPQAVPAASIPIADLLP